MTLAASPIKPAHECITTLWGPMSIGHPHEGHWHPEDVAETLGKIPRFNGHTPGVVIQVADHCRWVAAIARKLPGYAALNSLEDRRLVELAALVHDAHETVLGDRLSPVTRWETDRAGGRNTKQMVATAFDRAVYRAIGLPYPLPAHWLNIVADADAISFATERDQFQPLAEHRPGLPPPLPERLMPSETWQQAATAWLRAYDILGGGGRRS